MAVESMEMAPEAIPHPSRMPKQRLCPPNFVFDGGGAAELFIDEDWTLQGFRLGENI
jgi:hypothetical protein